MFLKFCFEFLALFYFFLFFYLRPALLLFYILFKVGICQCIGRSLCKMCWAACEVYWFALEDITCFLWRKLINTNRINRRRRRHFQDIEQGCSSTSSDETDFSPDHYRNLIHVNRKNYSFKRRRKERLNSFRSSSGFDISRHHRRVKLKSREVSAHVKGGSSRLRSSRQLQPRKVRSVGKKAKTFKRRRLRWSSICKFSDLSSD